MDTNNHDTQAFSVEQRPDGGLRLSAGRLDPWRALTLCCGDGLVVTFDLLDPAALPTLDLPAPTPALADAVAVLAGPAVAQAATALAGSVEAVGLYRRLAATDPEAHTANLAAALANSGVLLAEAGRSGEALAASEEAVGLYRGLAAADRYAHAANLAAALSSYGFVFSAAGRWGDAVAASEEAVGLYRGLAEVDPDGHAAGLARALDAYGRRLSEAGRGREALAASEKAAALRRGFADKPDGSPEAVGRVARSGGPRERDARRRARRLALLYATRAVHPEILADAEWSIDAASLLHDLPGLGLEFAALGELARAVDQLRAVIPRFSSLPVAARAEVSRVAGLALNRALRAELELEDDDVEFLDRFVAGTTPSDGELAEVIDEAVDALQVAVPATLGLGTARAGGAGGERSFPVDLLATRGLVHPDEPHCRCDLRPAPGVPENGAVARVSVRASPRAAKEKRPALWARALTLDGRIANAAELFLDPTTGEFSGELSVPSWLPLSDVRVDVAAEVWRPAPAESDAARKAAGWHALEAERHERITELAPDRPTRRRLRENAVTHWASAARALRQAGDATAATCMQRALAVQAAGPLAADVEAKLAEELAQYPGIATPPPTEPEPPFTAEWLHRTAS